MAPEDNINKEGNEEDKKFALPQWVHNMAKSWKTILILFTACTFILGISSQVLSFGLDFKAKFQQIEQNKIQIKNIKCKNNKEDKQATLAYKERRLAAYRYDYIDKGLDIPVNDREDYLGLPSKINTLRKEIDALNCGE